MSYYKKIENLTARAKSTDISKEDFKKTTAQIVEIINNNGIEALDLFKKEFLDYNPVSMLDYINGTALVQDTISEKILHAVLSGVTVPPKTCSPDKLPNFLYRGCYLSPSTLKKQNGYLRKTGERSLYKHQESTLKSVYISTTSELSIACEFAMQSDRRGDGCGGHWVYKIKPDGSSSCNDHFAPIRLHSSEHEYVFTEQLLYSQIVGVAWARDCDNLATNFYAPDDEIGILLDLLSKGLVSL